MRTRLQHDLGVAARARRCARRCARVRAMPAWVAMLLVLGLLWAQMLGLVHGVRHVHANVAHSAHGHQATHSHLAHTHADPAHTVPAHDGPQSLWEHLAAPDGDADDCRLYDQLGHGGPVAVPLIAALTQASPFTPAWVVLQALQPRPCAAFAARAPPASR